MNEPEGKNPEVGGDWSMQVDELANQVKMLALNLAISLARNKNQAAELAYLEPEFTRLINGSVEVIREVAAIMRSFRNEEKMVYSPPSQSEKLDRIETSLNEILSLSQSILKTVADIKKRKGKVDNYK
ncbi:hypothetical protein TRIP_C60515 [Candidatus Zixiibacteriota bacterium]|nr:hypothetical protein TRIP_C60515 [candidate division Zixibacteria bacterium]